MATSNDQRAKIIPRSTRRVPYGNSAKHVSLAAQALSSPVRIRAYMARIVTRSVGHRGQAMSSVQLIDVRRSSAADQHSPSPV